MTELARTVRRRSPWGPLLAAKDRWVYPLRGDERRVSLLRVNDESLVRAGCFLYSEAAA